MMMMLPLRLNCIDASLRAMVITMLITILLTVAAAGETSPAMFVFGDSLADVGNNNYLKFSIAKADFPHNGVDYLPNHKPTGRFSNGKNAADFLAEKLGLPTSPPYLALLRRKGGSNSSNFQAGVSFASGGAGIFNGTDDLYRQSIPLSKQIGYYSAVKDSLKTQLGEVELEKLQSNSIHAMVIGSNDVLGYFGSNSNFSKSYTPMAFISLMVDTIEAQLKLIYDLGGRKIAMIGVGPVGCCPAQRVSRPNGDCHESANSMASEYNKGLQSVLQKLKSQLPGFQYSYIDTYSVLLSFIQNPDQYGFKEVRAACCGLGYLNAKIACLPISSVCHNRTDHVFWDFYHPTEMAARMVIDTAFDGSLQYAHPINIRKLATLV